MWKSAYVSVDTHVPCHGFLYTIYVVFQS